MTGNPSSIENISQEGLEARIRDIARRLFTGQKVDDLETWHLAQVVENCSRAISDIYRTVNVDQIVSGDFHRPLSMEKFLPSDPVHSRRPFRRVTRVPEELKGIGDRCLYDIGMAGVRD